MYYNPFGQPVREESWKAVNPDNPYDTVDIFGLNDPTKVVRRDIVKLDGHTLRHGTWKYFDQDLGTVVKTEQYRFDKLIVAGGEDELAPIDITNTTATSNKKPVSDSTAKKTVSKPQAVLDYEKKNAGKKKVRTRTGETGNKPTP